ncbi:MAG: Wzy polymerase domain-containing protein [Rhodoferax sp.]
MIAFVAAILLTISWVIPEHFPPWINWHNELLAFASVIWVSACGLYVLGSQKTFRIQVPTVAGPVVLLVVVVVTQHAFDYFDFSGHALAMVFYLMLAVLALTCGFGTSSTANPRQGKASTIDCFAIVLVVGAVVSATIALVQVLDVWDGFGLISRMGSGRRPGGNINQPNQLATLLLMGMASLVYLFDARRLQCGSAFAISLVLLLGLSVTESRTGILSFFAMVGWWWVRRRAIGSRVAPRAVMAGSAFLVAIFLSWPHIYSLILVDGAPAAVNTSAGTRLLVWPQLLEAAWSRPWFGWGLGAVSKAHNAILGEHLRSEPFTYAHNVVIDLAVGVGLPLTVFMTGLTGLWLWRRVHSTIELVPWYSLALILPFGVHSMLEFPFAYSYLLVPAFFAVGVLEMAVAPNQHVSVAWMPAAGIFAPLVVLMALSAKEYIEAAEDFRVARFEVLGIGTTPATYERPHIRLLTQLDALATTTRIRPAPGMSADQIELMRKVAIQFPSIATQKRYAFSLALNGGAEEAVRQLKVMRAMYPPKYYAAIKANWEELTREAYPQLPKLALP